MGKGRIALCLALGSLMASAGAASADGAKVSGTSYGPGEYRLAGVRAACGSAQTLVSHELADYGASIPGTIVLNPDRMSRLPAATQLFVYAHECGHQQLGASEPAADCYAAQRGGQQGWLTPASAEAVCAMLPKRASSAAYAPREVRCNVIRTCLARKASPGSLAGLQSYRNVFGFGAR